MISSTLTEVLPAALAAGNSGASSYAGGDKVVDDFSDTDATGRPNLYIDFLGDNSNYTLWKETDANGDYKYYDKTPGKLQAPAGYDQSKTTNPAVLSNRWEGYKENPASTVKGEEVIFWVGVGLDRNDLQTLWSEGGAYSLELGFYYDPEYIVPYVGDGGFAATLAEANIGNDGYPGNTQWSDNYKILRAEYDRDPQTDPITQETTDVNSVEKAEPNGEDDMIDIMDGKTDRDWRMLYISLENTNAGSDARFDDAYDEDDAGRFLDGSYSDEQGTQYIMLIPFVYKMYDSTARLCLRLARNATHFSIGAGENTTTGTTTTGTEPYAAWERVTTRNPGKDIKLLTNFTGDLNIFTGGKVNDDPYTATLKIVNAGSAQNKAKLFVTDDPSPNRAYVDQSGSTLGGLDDGIGLSVEVQCYTGYWFEVTVTYYDDKAKKDVTLHYEKVTRQSNYTSTFVMPAAHVTVEVKFTPEDVNEYQMYLAEVTEPDTAVPVTGNYTKVTRNYRDDSGALAQATMDSNTAVTLTHPDNDHDDGPSMTAKSLERIEVEIETHADYEAVVYVKRFSTNSGLTGLTVTRGDSEPPVAESYTCPMCKNVYFEGDSELELDPAAGTAKLSCTCGKVTTDPNEHIHEYYHIVLPTGGTIEFTMESSDVDIVVTYRKADPVTATLAVYHKPDGTGDEVYDMDQDVAQLVYPEYDENNHPSSAYSGVVYHDTGADSKNAADDNHSAVYADKPDLLPWIHRSDATLSGALGGDHTDDLPCKKWLPDGTSNATLTSAESQNSIMALLARATSAGHFESLLLPRDLEKYGIYKNFQQEHYAQSELEVFADYLWEMATRIQNDSTGTLSSYLVTVPDPAVAGGTLYSYFNLTPDQVQEYLVQCWNVELGDEENHKRYHEEKGYYDVAQAAYAEAVDMLIRPTAPVAPVDAPDWSVDTTTGVRSYADSGEYANYIAQYRAYIEDYQEYIDTVLADRQDKIGGYDNCVTMNGAAPAPDYTAAEINIIKKVDLKDAAAAQAAIDAVVWTPGTVGTTPSITTRSGREVWVVLQAESGWTVDPNDPVEVYDSSGNLMSDVTVTPSSDYINVYVFEMPEENCTVRVNYVRRETHRLLFVVTGANGISENVSELTAYGPQTDENEDMTKPAHHFVKSDHNQEPFQWPTGGDVYVYADGTLSLKVGEADGVGEDYGYQATVTVEYLTSGGSWVGYWGPRTVTDGEVLSIPMTSGDVRVIVRYVPDTDPHTAKIVVEDNPSSIASGSTGLWQNDDPMDTNKRNEKTAYEGDSLTADITIEPGYYIHSVTAIGESGAAYPFVLSGNGYANGLNSDEITVTVDVTMPDEDLVVTVEVREGLPPEEGDFPLSLAVVDGDNTDPDDPANNRAWLEVEPGNDATSIGPVGKALSTTFATGYANAGDEVRIHFSAATGYYVSSVVVAPTGLSIPLEWVYTSTGPYVKFVMPAGSAGVTVEFKEGTAPIYNLFLAKTEVAVSNISENRAPTVHSDSLPPPSFAYTIGGDLPVVPGWLMVPDQNDTNASSIAKAGELVTLDLAVENGWYVHSVTVTDAAGNALSNQLFAYDSAVTTLTATTYITNTNTTTHTADGAVKFTMPNGDANVVVHYRQGDPPTNPEDRDYAMTLTVADPDNNTVLRADNWAQATVAGTAVSTTDQLGLVHGVMTDLAYAKAGDLVTIEYDEADGFALDIIVVTPSGLNIVPVYLGGGKAQFTMPAENVQVLVKFKQGKATEYTANLVLRGPGNTVIDVTSLKVGGTFTEPTIGVLANYPDHAIFSQTAVPGETLYMDLFATDGYYIKKITVTPAHLGVEASLTGSFGRQEAWTVMPAGNITINVYFEKDWPDFIDDDDDDPEDGYPITLEVIDPAYVNGAGDNSYAQLTAPIPSGAVYGGGSETVLGARDNNRVYVKIAPKAGYTYDRTTVTVVDRAGNPVDWSYAMVDGAAGVTFTMPPNGVTVTVRFRPVADSETTYNVKLVTSGNGTATVTDTVRPSSITGNDTITDVKALSPIEVVAAPATGGYVKAAYAVTDSGEQLVVPMTQVTTGGTVKFAMPEEDVTVHVIFSDAGDPVPTGNDLPATLIVSGPAGSGRATMGKTGDTPISVNAGGANMLFAKQGDGLTVTIDPTTGYLIKSLTVIDRLGNPVSYTWNSGSYDPTTDVWVPGVGYQFTLNMPAGGLTVHVVLEENTKPDEKYTAQVVVNNTKYTDTGTSNNNAWLRNVGESVKEKLIHAKAGDIVELDVTVHPGYKIDYVVVTPQSHGIVPTLTKGFASDQTTSFIMPADDVVVYVKFVKDDLDRRTATLVVKGDRGTEDTNNLGGNHATIHSNRTGTSKAIDSGDPPESVLAAPVTEWVTVDYVWEEGYVATVTVVDETDTPVPFTQVNPNKITLPMVDSNVVITVTYGTEPMGYPVVLHSIALDEKSENVNNVATITYAYYNDTGIYTVVDQADAYAECLPITGQPELDSADPDNDRTILVPAGETVDLDIVAVNDTYIKAAYVLYEAGGQMISCNLKWDPVSGTFVSPQATEFAVHPGRNDVYVYYTTEKPAGEEYAAVLMLDGPNNSGSAAISGTAVNRDPVSATVIANGPHGYIIPEPGENVTVTVTPEPGYVIDTVLVTPLGITGNDGQPLTVPMSLSASGVYSGAFEMPWENVAVYVKLKESVTRDYYATLHYIQEGASAAVDVENRADLYYKPSGVTVPAMISADLNDPVDSMKVSQGSTVSLSAVVNPVDDGADKESYILAAYVLNSATLTLERLDPALEGFPSGPDASMDYDGTATFTMPAADVDVYLVVGDEKPAENWHTAILLVTDTDRDGVMNIGGNSSDLKDDGKFDGGATSQRMVVAMTGDATDPAMGHERMYVTVGQEMTLNVHDPKLNYQFEFADISNSAGVADDLESTNNPNQYTYEVKAWNSAVRVHYGSALEAASSLTVEILDPDNPGDGTVTNTVKTEPGTMTPLTLNSVNHAGAYQIIRPVTAGEQVKITVTPNAGYKAVAEYTYNGTTREILLAADGTGYFQMPGYPAKVTVKFYRAYDATLTVKDVGLDAASSKTSNMTGTASQFTMTESDRGKSVTTQINFGLESDPVTLPELPHGTGLTVTPNAGVAPGSIVGVLVTTDSGSYYLSDDGTGAYRHSINRSDADIVVLLNNDASSAGDLYMARVETVGLPAGYAAKNMVSIKSSGDQANGAIWTMAANGNTITTTIVDVPAGYEARVSAADTAGNPVTLTGTTTLTDDGTVTFTMRAADVVVTVEYVKVAFELTLNVVDTTTEGSTTTLNADSINWTVSSGNYNNSATVADGTGISLTATPAGDARIVAVMMTTSVETTIAGITYPAGTNYLSGVRTGGDSYATTLTMPKDDMTLTVIYGDVPEAVPDDPAGEPYIAATQKVNDGGVLHNAITSIVNTTTSGLLSSSPHWTQAYKEDGVSVTFTTAPGWYAEVTAVKQSDGITPVTVIQQGNTGTGTAFIVMPDDDVLITVKYQTDPPTDKANLKLTLIKPDGQANNNGNVYDLSSDTDLTSLTVAGSYNPNSDKVSNGNTVPVPVGDRLVVSGNWETDYRIEKITVTVGDVEMELPRNSYGQNATALFYMPGIDAEVRIYFASIYTATLHIVDPTGGNTTSMTDSRTGADTVYVDGGQLTELNGGETIMTTAIPNTGNWLVGVVRVTATTGAARVPLSGTADRYDFTMPTEDVHVYAVYEPDSDDPSYIAKVAIDPDSEGYGVGGNRVEITNASDPTAAHDTSTAYGSFWTAAKGGDTIDVTVGLEPGYQALITEVVEDNGNVPIYINRLIFVTDGTVGTFTMPVASDATVTIKYMRGYNLSLEVSDNSGITSGSNTAQVLEDAGGRTITATSAGTTASVVYDYNANNNADDMIRVIGGVAKDTGVVATSTPANGVKTRIFRSSYFGGTEDLVYPADTGTKTGNFTMPAEDVLVSVLFQDENDPYDLIAKVELKGESAIVGNGYVSDGNGGVKLSPKIVDTDDLTGTTIGQIWSTTQAGDAMKVTFTVAEGYMVEIQVRRDSNLSYIMSDDGKFSTDGNSVTTSTDKVVVYHGGGADMIETHTFGFVMETGRNDDVTVVLTYVKAATIPKPYDPTHAAKTPLKEGWIYGENRGDYAVVTVPTLHRGGENFDADQYDRTDASTKVTFRFFIALPDDPSVKTELVVGKDIILEPYDVNTLAAGDPYNYDNFYSDASRDYIGAKFNLRLAETTPTSAAAKALALILNNKGTETTPELFIMAQNAKGEISEYTQVVITPTYGLAIRFYSYAPTHAATVSLYRLTDTAADPMKPASYESEPMAQAEVVNGSGTGLWRQTAVVRTANLLGDPVTGGNIDPDTATDLPTYMLVIEKPSHITYTRVNITLKTAYADGNRYDADRGIYAYNADTKTFTIRDDAILLAGDVDGSGSVKVQDRYTVTQWSSGRYKWSDAKDSTDQDAWKISIYNPDSQAYWCDLDGDGRVSYQDYVIVNYTKHYGATAEWYEWTDGDGNAILPWGMEELSATTALMSLEEEDGVYDLEEDTGIYDLEEDTGIYDLEDDTGIYDVEDGDGVYDLSGDTTLYPVVGGGTVDGTKEPAALPPSDEETDALLPEEKKDEEETADPPEDTTQ